MNQIILIGRLTRDPELRYIAGSGTPIVKGSLVGIQGSLRIDNYKNEAGENRRAVRVNANRVQFLDNRKNNNQEQAFEPGVGLEHGGWNAIEDDDIPF